MRTLTVDRSGLVLKNIHKYYGSVRALSEVDLQIDQGEILALLGSNGAGKTTLVSIAAGLCSPNKGEVWIHGTNMLTNSNEARQHLGLAPQSTGIYPTLPVYDNLRFFGELLGLKRSRIAERIDEVADAFGLSNLMSQQAGTLSGGEARRLHTAMILLRRPPLLLLDEPTTGVDISTRARLLELVGRLAAEGSAICYSTHYLAEVEQLESSIAILDHGRIVAQGPLQTLRLSHGQSTVELCFDGPPPELDAHRDVKVFGQTLVITANGEPAVKPTTLIAELGDAVHRLRSMRFVQPSLESVFLSVTGRSMSDSLIGSDDGRDA